jgi:probable HAF family extracellular repeat protein
MRLKWLPSILVLAFLATSALAAPQARYRLKLIAGPLEGSLTATAMNNRGEVVGTRGAPDGQYAFVWSDGTFVDLQSRINPAASFVEASGINDRSQVVGFYVDPEASVFRGFLLDRRQVTDVQGPPTAAAVFLGAINDREQILGSFYDAGGNEGYFVNEEGSVLVFDPSFGPIDINVSGTVSGTQFSGGSRAAIWEDGVITPIAPAPSSGRDINDRGQVIGSLTQTGGSRAFVWERGQLTVLPALIVNQTSSWANDINNSGRIVGETTLNQPTGSAQFATVWDNGQVVDLNTLIHPDDPLRAYVSLRTGTLINDRGEIVALGADSRVGFLQYYFLEPARGH